jgi:hypothetical protein
MKRVLREPLFHFLIAGAALFAASGFLSDRDAPQPDDIVVSAGQIDHLAARFARTWRRPPTTDELQGLVDDYVREEVAYREGLAMGLDTDDTIIRRRIRQKLDFIASDIASLAEPAAGELEEYLAAHADDFRIPPRYTFLQVYFDPNKRGESCDADARSLLDALRRDPDMDIRDLGDTTLLGYALKNLSAEDIFGMFGQEFVVALQKLDWPAADRPVPSPGPWHGPLPSGYGLHLVRLDAKSEGRLPALAEIADAVRREWENTHRNEVKERFYADLLQRYTVTIEWPELEAEGGGP